MKQRLETASLLCPAPALVLHASLLWCVPLQVLKASSNKDLKVYLLVALIASTGVMALVPYAVKTLP
jgi:hypothetical protein